MNENDYAKLNSYLNDIFNYMEDFDECLFLNLSSIYNISEYIYNSLQESSETVTFIMPEQDITLKTTISIHGGGSN